MSKEIFRIESRKFPSHIRTIEAAREWRAAEDQRMLEEVENTIWHYVLTQNPETFAAMMEFSVGSEPAEGSD